MKEHPKLHDPETVIVEEKPLWDRVDYVPCNKCAHSWLNAWGKKSFNTDELKFIASMGYCVLVLGKNGQEEFK